MKRLALLALVVASLALLWASKGPVVERVRAWNDRELPTVETLLVRYGDICLKAYPDDASLTARVGALSLYQTDMSRYQSITHDANMHGWTGDLGGHGPNPTRELAVAIGSSPRRGCSVLTMVTRAPDDFSGFGKLVRSFVANRTHGQLFDLSASAATASERLGYTTYLQFDWLSEQKKDTEQFVAEVRPLPTGQVSVQFIRYLKNQ